MGGRARGRRKCASEIRLGVGGRRCVRIEQLACPVVGKTEPERRVADGEVRGRRCGGIRRCYVGSREGEAPDGDGGAARLAAAEGRGGREVRCLEWGEREHRSWWVKERGEVLQQRQEA
ncbi:hypothetical protein MTO96_005354 [Rhipicephalus appendiculatus]